MAKCTTQKDTTPCVDPETLIEDGLILRGSQYRATMAWINKNFKEWGLMSYYAKFTPYLNYGGEYPYLVELDYEFFERRDKKQKNRS